MGRYLRNLVSRGAGIRLSSAMPAVPQRPQPVHDSEEPTPETSESIDLALPPAPTSVLGPLAGPPWLAHADRASERPVEQREAHVTTSRSTPEAAAVTAREPVVVQRLVEATPLPAQAVPTIAPLPELPILVEKPSRAVRPANGADTSVAAMVDRVPVETTIHPVTPPAFEVPIRPEASAPRRIDAPNPQASALPAEAATFPLVVAEPSAPPSPVASALPAARQRSAHPIEAIRQRSEGDTVHVRIGAIEIRATPMAPPPAPTAAGAIRAAASPVGFDGFALLRRYGRWGR